MQKQPTKESVVSQDNKVTEPRAPSLTNDEVEEFRAYFNEKMSIFQKGGKRSEGTDFGLANGISDEEEEEKDEEEIEEKLGKAKGYQPGSVPSTDDSPKNKEVPLQFLARDGDEEEEGEEDGLDADFLKVKRHNVFGLDLKENKSLQVSVLPVEGLLLFPITFYVLLCCFWATMGKQELGEICKMTFFALYSPFFSTFKDRCQRIQIFLKSGNS